MGDGGVRPTGHRWRVLAQLAGQRGLALVCVQPLLDYGARDGEDMTFDKSDPKDAFIIARLAARAGQLDDMTTRRRLRRANAVLTRRS